SDDANPNGITQQLVNISIQANSLPEVDNKDLSFVQSDNSKSVQVTFNDSDIGQTHSYQIVNQGAKGTATIDQNGLLTYVPSFSASGADSVTFSVIDNAIPGGVGEGVLTISIDPNAAPELLGPSEVTILTSRSFDYQFSATDINPNQELIFSISQFPSEVNAFIDQTSGLLTISAGEFFVGLDSVEITVFDNGNPQLNDVINLTINVDKGNTRPNPTANDIDVLAGTSGTTQIFPNDPDLNNLHNYLILQQPTNGIASVDSTGLVTYTPNLGFTGNETINVSVTDNGEPNLGAIVSISVSVQSNSAPDPIGTSIEILAGRNESFLLDPNDPDANQSWTYSVDVVPTDGAVSVDQSGNVDFSTDNLESGSGTFEIKVTDDGNPNLSGNAIFNYTIIENGEPIVGSDSIFVNKNTPFNGQLSWSDINQAIQTFSFSITSNPSNGSVSIDQSGNFTYTPNAEYLGADQFSVRVTDDTGLFGEGTISVTVSEGNLNPVINGVTFDVLDTSGPFKTRFTLDVDDPDGDVVSGVIDFGDGRPSQVLDTSIVPEEFLNPIYHQYDSSGSYTVSLTITDNSGGTANLTAPIDVNLNSPPVANISANTFSGVAPLIVNFDATSSSDDTGINEYVWRVLETDEEYFGASPSITFSNSGLYNVVLKLKDVDSAVTFA
ncbi:MAG: Ig-like domain-containing protein, partial [bacterium]|nr:Ig-like domain-containing protein [bacterium]